MASTETPTPGTHGDNTRPEIGTAAPPPPAFERGTRAVVAMLMPLVEAYAGRFTPSGAAGEGDAAGSGLFTRREEAVLAAAGRKLFAETVDYTSHHYAVSGATPYEAMSKNGQVEAPGAVQLLSLFRAASAILIDRDPPAPDAPAGHEPQVELLAVKPGEYPYSDVPVTPAEARRAAYMQRLETPPPPATLAPQKAHGYAIVPVPSSDGGGGQAAMMRSGAAHASMAFTGGQGGCGCGSCAGGGAAGFVFPAAQYNADGTCKPLFGISCDTRWRVRECLKVAVCDALRCLGGELCDDGQFNPHPDYKRCIEQFVCTIVTCLPEALCPEPQAAPCLPGGMAACGCNFAVGN